MNLHIDTFSEFLGENNLPELKNQFEQSLLEVVTSFNNESWTLLENELIQRAITNFLLWKNELRNILVPYITH
ncbi:hypothetical protein D3C85_1872910 [compost metagenome]